MSCLTVSLQLKAHFSFASLVFLTVRSVNSNGSPRAATGEEVNRIIL